jgi:hypothetical protein
VEAEVAVAAAEVVAAEVAAAEVEVAAGVVAVAAAVAAAAVVAGVVAAAAVWAADAAASSLEAVSAAVAAAVAPDPAGYGHRLGAGSTAAGVALRLRQGHLLSRRSKSRRRPREELTERVLVRVPNNVRRLQSVLRGSVSFVKFAAIRRASSKGPKN